MEINEEIKESNRKIVLLKDDFGNTATGATYKDALKHLMNRRKIATKERGSKNGLV